MKRYQKEMDIFRKEMENYNREVQQYNEEIVKNARKIAENFSKKTSPENNKTNRNQIEYEEKSGPNCQIKSDYKVQPGDKYCRNCGAQLIEKSKFNLSEKEDK